MDNETYQTIIELRSTGKRWGEIYKYFDLKFKSVKQMVKFFEREKQRRKSNDDV